MVAQHSPLVEPALTANIDSIVIRPLSRGYRTLTTQSNCHVPGWAGMVERRPRSVEGGHPILPAQTV
jgi:hypothetical protein